MYLRHEAGHAFNYAYALYRTPEWRDLFGPFRRPYRDDYRPVPFSRRFVRHIAGWYAQKHPDEDFAETFAVWLTPRSQWRKRYQRLGRAGEAALRRPHGAAGSATRSRCRKQRAHRRHGRGDGDDRRGVLQAGARRSRASRSSCRSTPTSSTSSRSRKRKKKGARPAADLLRENRKTLVDKVTYWTGVQRPLVKRLVESIETPRRASSTCARTSKRERST